MVSKIQKFAPLQRALYYAVICLLLLLLICYFWFYPGGCQGVQEMAPPTGPAKIKILCWVLSLDTRENNVKSLSVEETWGARCDKLLVVKNGSRLAEEPAGRLLVPVQRESRDELWHKVVATVEFLYATHLHEYDWFFKADDDTYLIVDSLRHFLASKSSPEEPIYFGHRFKPFVRQGYMSGGSGYALSREALARLVERGIRKRLPACDLAQGKVEDVLMGRCLEAAGVAAGDTRDSLGRETFLAVSPEMLISEHFREPDWYGQYAYYTQPADNQLATLPAGKRSRQRCSNTPISFHYIEPSLMYLIDWLLHDVAHYPQADKRAPL